MHRSLWVVFSLFSLLLSLCSALSEPPSQPTPSHASEGAAPQQSTRAGGSGTSFLGIESLLGLKPLAAVYGTPLSKGSRRLGPRKLKTVMLETPDAFASGVPNPMANVQEDTARPSMPKVIKGVSEIASKYDAFILDQFGVMHNGVDALPGALECFQHLVESGKQIVILSNTSRRSADATGKLPGMGFNVNAIKALVSSGEEAWRYVEATRKGQKCTLLTWKREAADGDPYLSGLDVAVTAVAEADFILCHGTEVIRDGGTTAEEVSYMQTGDVAVFQEVLDEGVKRGLEMIVCNPDLRVSLPGGATGYMPGGVAQRYEMMGGRVTWFGKPFKRHFDSCLQYLGPDIKRDRVVHVGDSMDHDVKGATGAAIDSLFIAAGIHAEDAGLRVAHNGEAEGDLTPEAVAKVYEDEGAAATWACKTFTWH